MSGGMDQEMGYLRVRNPVGGLVLLGFGGWKRMVNTTNEQAYSRGFGMGDELFARGEPALLEKGRMWVKWLLARGLGK